MEKRTKVKEVMLKGIVLIFVFLPILLFYAQVGEVAPKPVPTGSLVIAQDNFGEEGFLPDIGGSDQTGIWELVYDQLIYIDHKTDKPLPGLALKWETSKDYRTLTLSLRKGVPWHEGWGEVTAEDVKYTFDRITGPKATNTFTADFKKIVESIKIIDAYTLVFQLRRPDPFFWFNFTNAQNPFMPIICKKYVEKVGDDKATQKPIGSGPYRLVEHKLGDYLKFEALNEHWRIVPEFKYITMRIVPEDSTRMAMLQTGEVDIAAVVPDKMAQLKRAGINILTWTGYVVNLSFGGMTVPEDKRYVEGISRKDPWADIRVREAMNISIDREAIAKSIYFGAAKPFPLYGDWPGWDELELIPYNPKRAKALLAEAGYPNGFSFKAYAHEHDGAPELTQVVQACAGYWEQIGLKPTLDMTDWPSAKPKVQAGKDNGYITPWRQTYAANPSYKVEMYRMPGGTYPCFQHEEIIALGKKLFATMDWEERIKILRKLSKVDYDLYASIPLVMAQRLWGVSKKVGEWPGTARPHLENYVYIRHAKPVNTWRLFTP